VKRLRRPRMTRQLVGRLIDYARRAEGAYGDEVMDNFPGAERKERQCLADIDWLWRMHDWFEANRELAGGE